jgi:hypothetical protein
MMFGFLVPEMLAYSVREKAKAKEMAENPDNNKAQKERSLEVAFKFLAVVYIFGYFCTQIPSLLLLKYTERT